MKRFLKKLGAAVLASTLLLSGAYVGASKLPAEAVSAKETNVV